jgi:hypothetical protein
MSNITGTIRGRATLESATTPTVYNVAVTLANTEVSQVLSPSTKQFTIKVRGTAKLQLAFESGQSGVTYLTVRPGNTYTSEGLDYNGALFFQTDQAAQIVEIVEWS